MTTRCACGELAMVSTIAAVVRPALLPASYQGGQPPAPVRHSYYLCKPVEWTAAQQRQWASVEDDW